MSAFRPDLEQLANHSDFDEKSMLSLLRAMNTRRTIAFLGSGVSIPYGAGTWGEMTDRLSRGAHLTLDTYLDEINRLNGGGVNPQLRDRMKRLKLRLEFLESENAQRQRPDRASAATGRSELNLSQLELYRLAHALVHEAHQILIRRPDVRLPAYEAPGFHETIAELFKSDLLSAKQRAFRRINAFARGLSGTNEAPKGPRRYDLPLPHPWAHPCIDALMPYRADTHEPKVLDGRAVPADHRWAAPFGTDNPAEDGDEEPDSVSAKAKGYIEHDRDSVFLFQEFYSVAMLKRLVTLCECLALKTEDEQAAYQTGQGDSDEARSEKLDIRARVDARKESASTTKVLLRAAIEALEQDAESAGKDAEVNGMPPDRRSFIALIFSGVVAAFAREHTLNSSIEYQDPDELGRALLSGLGKEIASNRDWSSSSRVLLRKLEKQRGECLANIQLTCPGPVADGKRTYGEVRPRTDLVETIVSQLGFWRILTTNYDDEVERYLELINYPRGTLSDRQDINRTFDPNLNRETGRRSSRSFLGQSAASDVLTGSSVAQLVDIATRSHDVGARVMHLHGRADKPDTIIATESDYQSLYMSQKAERYSFDNALHVVFSGNPVIFIGSGLQEQDLQRPLREFASNNGGDGRELFALLPALHRKDSLEWIKIENYFRYGVRTIFYGSTDRSLELEGKLKNATSADREQSTTSDPSHNDIDYEPLQLAPLNKSIGGHIASIDRLLHEIKSLREKSQSLISDIESLRSEVPEEAGSEPPPPEPARRNQSQA